MEVGVNLGIDAHFACRWTHWTLGPVFAVAFALFACTAWATVADGVKMSVADVRSVKASAEKGEAKAQFRYAEMLRDGRGVKKDVREAVVWTRKAADGGLAAAQCQMGLFYMNGLGVDRDEDKAVEWLNKAAAQHYAQAQYNLGIYYAKFFDRESARQAVKWLNEAAKQDYADAQYNLAHLYLNPHHPASREQGAGRRAIALLRRAAAQGHAAAKAKLKELGVAMPQSQDNVKCFKQSVNGFKSSTWNKVCRLVSHKWFAY